MPTVADIMDREPATVSPDDKVRDVIEALQTNDLPGLPVVDETRKVLGIITENDLVINKSHNGALHGISAVADTTGVTITMKGTGKVTVSETFTSASKTSSATITAC